MRVRMRWMCCGGHGAVPAEAGCPMILCLYTGYPLSSTGINSQISPVFLPPSGR
jgi:hypothetical protein